MTIKMQALQIFLWIIQNSAKTGLIIIIWGLKLQFQINISQPSSRKFLGMKKKHSDLLWSNKYFSLFTTSYIKIFCLFDKFYKTIEWLSCPWEVLKNFEKFLRRKCKVLPISNSWLIGGSISVSYLEVIFVNGCPLEEVDGIWYQNVRG